MGDEPRVLDGHAGLLPRFGAAGPLVWSVWRAKILLLGVYIGCCSSRDYDCLAMI